MITQIVTQNQKLLGYVVDKYFLPYNLILSTCKSLPKADKTIIGARVRNFVTTSDGSYDLKRDCLSSLEGSILNLDVKDICFIEREPCEDDLAVLSSFWRLNKLTSNFVYTITDNNFKVLGFIMTNSRIEYGKDCYICMFEVINKGSSNGSRIISNLSKKVSMRGYSCLSAISFWNKMGAIFIDDFHFKIRQNI